MNAVAVAFIGALSPVSTLRLHLNNQKVSVRVSNHFFIFVFQILINRVAINMA